MPPRRPALLALSRLAAGAHPPEGCRELGRFNIDVVSQLGEPFGQVWLWRLGERLPATRPMRTVEQVDLLVVGAQSERGGEVPVTWGRGRTNRSAPQA